MSAPLGRARNALVGLLVLIVLPANAPGAPSTALPGRTVRVAVGLGPAAPNGPSSRPSISADGNVVAFDSTASNLTANDDDRIRGVFVRYLPDSTLALVSIGPDGAADGPSSGAAISGDGTTVAFTSAAGNLVAGDSNRRSDVFVRHTAEDAYVRIPPPPPGR